MSESGNGGSIIRLALIGDACVGKTEIFRWLKEEYHGSIGVDAAPTATSSLPPPTPLDPESKTRSEYMEMLISNFIDDPEYPYNRDVIHIFRSAQDSNLPEISSSKSRLHVQHPNKNQCVKVRTHHNGKYWPTVSPSFYTFEDIGGSRVQIWDLSGQRQFSLLAYSFCEFREMDGFILTYDMTSKNSFLNLEWWHKNFVEARHKAIVNEVKYLRKRARSSLKKSGGGSQGGEAVLESLDLMPSGSQAPSAPTKVEDNFAKTPGSGLPRSFREEPAPPPFVVVGTKADFEEGRQIAHASVADFCDLYQGDEDSIIGAARFFEVSARVPGEGASIMTVLEHLVSKSLAAATELRALSAHDRLKEVELGAGVQVSVKISGNNSDGSSLRRTSDSAFNKSLAGESSRGCSGGECSLQ